MHVYRVCVMSRPLTKWQSGSIVGFMEGYYMVLAHCGVGSLRREMAPIFEGSEEGCLAGDSEGNDSGLGVSYNLSSLLSPKIPMHSEKNFNISSALWGHSRL